MRMRIDVTRHQGGVTQLDDVGARGNRDVGADRLDPDAPDHHQPRRNQRAAAPVEQRSAEHTSELQSLMRLSYDVFCLKKKLTTHKLNSTTHYNSRTRQINQLERSHHRYTTANTES